MFLDNLILVLMIDISVGQKNINRDVFFTDKTDYISVTNTLNKLRKIDLYDWKTIANRFSKTI